MTLPTIQPVDYPDWATLPTFTYQFFNTDPINAGGDIIVSADTGYYSHALLVLSSDGDGSDWNASIQWWSAAPTEGGSLVYEQPVTRVWPYNVVVPMTAWAPRLIVIDDGASAYPHNAIGSLTLFSQWGSMTGFPGGTRVILEFDTVAAGAAQVFVPLGCAPGRHGAQISTNAATWTLDLRTWVGPGTYYDMRLATNATAIVYDIEWIAPPSSWALVWTNTTALSRTVTAIVNREPT